MLISILKEDFSNLTRIECFTSQIFGVLGSLILNSLIEQYTMTSRGLLVLDTQKCFDKRKKSLETPSEASVTKRFS